MMDLVIRGGHVVTPHRVSQLDIAVRDGKIAALLAPTTPCAAATQLDATGLHVLPGLIDAHVHMREPGLTHKETLVTGTRAAACGGVTTVLDMPNTVPPVTDPDTLLAKGALIEGQAQVDVGLFALLGPHNLHQIENLAATGCLGFKLFLGPTTGNLHAPDWGAMLAVMPQLAELSCPVIAHAEDREIIEHWQLRTGCYADDYSGFLASRPAFGEVDATYRICRLAGATGAQVHIAHVAVADAVEAIAVAKRAGWLVTAETCPPYLLLTADDYPRVGTAMKVLPPVRHATDQAALWQGLRAGVIDLVATDHAPHTAAEKSPSLQEAASGAPGVETMLPLLLDAARQGRCSLQNIAQWCAAGPAERFGLTGKGMIAPGNWADLVLVDLARRWQISADKLHSLEPQSPFVGWSGQGAPVMTMLRGRIVADQGEPVGKPAGRWVRR